MKGTGLMINHTVKENKHLRMVQYITEISKKGQKMVMESTNGWTSHYTKENGKIINSMVLENTRGVTVESMSANGKII